MIQAEHKGLPGNASCEKQLWCSVLELTLEDLAVRLPAAPVLEERVARFGKGHGAHTNWAYDMAKWQNANAATISARSFAFGRDNKWRGTVCDFAGVTEECFVKRARAIVAAL